MCPYGKWCNDQQDILFFSSSLEQSQSLQRFKGVCYIYFRCARLQVILEETGKALQISLFSNDIYVVNLL